MALWTSLGKTESVALTVVVILALVLRVWGIGFGLPYIYHPDEHYYVNTALNLGAGVLNNPPYTPTGLANMLFAQYAGYYVAGRVLGLWDSPSEFEVAYRRDPTIFFLLARLTTTVLGAATVLALFVLGRMVGDARIGLLAAGLLAVSFLHVRDSHYAVPDVALPFFVTLATALAAAGVRHRKGWLVYLAGVAGGLAAAAKWTGLPVVITVLWASGSIVTKVQSGLFHRLASRTTLFTALLLGAGFALGSPQILANPAPYINEALGQCGAGQAGGFEIWQVDTLPGWLFYGKTLLYGMGAIPLALGVAGMFRRVVTVFRSHDALSLLVLSFPLAYYLPMGLTSHYFARYALVLMPFVALLAADVAMAASARFVPKHPGLGLALTSLAVLAIAIEPLVKSIRHDMLLTHQDTRTLAKQWIEATIPEGTKIAVDWPVHGPPLSTAKTPVPYSSKVYDVTTVGGTGLSDHPTAWYREQGFGYVIASSFIYNIPLVHKDQDAERRTFYASLGDELELVQEFRPCEGGAEPLFVFDEIYGPAIGLWQRERPGPVIKIYRVR